MTIDQNLLVLLLALLLDWIVGDPERLWSRIPHPVTIFGKAISHFDRQFNSETLTKAERRLNGTVSITILLALSAAAGVVLHGLFGLLGFVGTLFEVACVAILLAQKSLSDHVSAVMDALRGEGIFGGRKAVSRIVGRDPEILDEAGVCRAAIESLAENFSDGVVAPALWYALLGLPGLFMYKMLNTADSMIGHKTEKYIDFGWAAARLDDIANWPAARLSILLIAAGAWLRRGVGACRNALRIAIRDGKLHRSPNSGRPEAAMAGALNIQLAGPRVYSGILVKEPRINGAGRDIATPEDVEEALAVFNASCMVTAIAVFVIFFALL